MNSHYLDMTLKMSSVSEVRGHGTAVKGAESFSQLYTHQWIQKTRFFLNLERFPEWGGHRWEVSSGRRKKYWVIGSRSRQGSIHHNIQFQVGPGKGCLGWPSVCSHDQSPTTHLRFLWSEANNVNITIEPFTTSQHHIQHQQQHFKNIPPRRMDQ